MREYSQSEDQGTRMMTGFMMGALVGAGIALLLAPGTGEENRRRLRETASRLRDNADEAISSMRDRFDEMRHGSEASRDSDRQHEGAPPMGSATTSGQPYSSPGGRPA